MASQAQLLHTTWLTTPAIPSNAPLEQTFATQNTLSAGVSVWGTWWWGVIAAPYPPLYIGGMISQVAQ